MTSVQENKNELEAAVRYCESAISRAKATIESMEFRQQAASKAWHEQTGRESALEYAVNDLKLKNEELEDTLAQANGIISKMRKREKEIIDEVARLERDLHVKTSQADEHQALHNESDLSWGRAWKKEAREIKEKYDEAKTNMALLTDENLKLRETNNLQRDQIAMFQRKMSRMNEMEK
jgi:chromosome segregation ATPase